MCGIVGYIGNTNNTNCVDILLQGLTTLEYRGYDSAGIAIINNQKLQVQKNKGKLKVLKNSLQQNPLQGSIGIGHTRWATHGKPNNVNSHPHTNSNGTLAIVHNGIIENYLQLKQNLQSQGYTFVSQTDSEIIAHLIDSHLKTNNNLLQALQQTSKLLQGNYAIVAISALHNSMVAICNNSPLVVGLLDNAFMVASDSLAMLHYTNTFIKLNNQESIQLTNSNYQIYNSHGTPITKPTYNSAEKSSNLSKEGFNHFMLKEIYEQPEKINNTLNANVVNNQILPNINLPTNINNVYFVACGTSYYSSLIGANIISKLAKINSYCFIASEIKTYNFNFTCNDLVIFVSQSGETADTIMAINYIKQNFACSTLAIINVLGSSIEFLVDNVIYTKAMAEIAVASTKAYTTQLSVMYLLAMRLANLSYTNYSNMFAQISASMHNFINNSNTSNSTLNAIANYLSNYSSVFYLGRDLDYFTTLEGALKLKEISYIHAESFMAGELKHGSIALITNGTPVIVVLTQSAVAYKVVSNIAEVVARGGYIICITLNSIAKQYNLHSLCNVVVEIDTPTNHQLFAPLLAVVPLQLIAYKTAVLLNKDVDKPRNLAKSVTVE